MQKRRHYTSFKSHISVLPDARVIMVGYAGSAICIVLADMTDPIQGQGHRAMTVSPLPRRFYLNNATNLHHLTSHGKPCCPTMKRS